MKSFTPLSLLALTTTTLAACSREGFVEITFFGYPDNDPPSARTACNCGGRNNIAGGSETYDDPLTMVSAQGEFNRCETIYVLYLQEYVRYEDCCQQCTDDLDGSGKKHIDIWTGSSTLNGGNEQVQCENKLKPDGNNVVFRSPATNLNVDTAPLYHKGTSNPCRTNHVVRTMFTLMLRLMTLVHKPVISWQVEARMKT